MDAITRLNLRKHERTTKSCIARFRFHDGFLKDSKWEMVSPRNISAGGIQFLYDKDVKVGELMDFVINIPGIPEQIKCEGMVLRVNKNKDSFFGQIAAGFTNIGQSAIEGIDRIAASR